EPSSPPWAMPRPPSVVLGHSPTLSSEGPLTPSKSKRSEFHDSKRRRIPMETIQEMTEVLPPNVPTIPIVERSDVDIQISTAHRYPRSISRFKQAALAMATSDEETAASCFYKLSRGGKEIEGPGVRLAEIVGSAWNNLRYGSRIVGEDDRWVIAQGMAHDL